MEPQRNIASSNIVSLPVAKRSFTFGEYENFISKSPKFTWSDYNNYQHIISKCYKIDVNSFIRLEDIVSFK
tara:strand:- start:18834 stop:19046 length:213 start_codon:yes stop_codon:yes gene_type:complete